MIRCHTCQTANLDTSRFCDECGTRLIQTEADRAANVADYVPPHISQPSVNVASIGSPAVQPLTAESLNVSNNEPAQHAGLPAHATLVIERGGTTGTEFPLINDDSTIGRWDADNGIFPDVDLDTHDDDAKVSRRHPQHPAE